MSDCKINTRKSVFELLLRMEKGAYSSIVLDVLYKSTDFKPNEKKFITALFYGVIERQITLDYVIDKFASTKPDLHVRILIRMALYQILFMEGVPQSAAVNESVNLAPKRSRGFVNAVLRNFLRAERDFLNKEAEENLSLKYSSPDWLVQKWMREYGSEETLQILRTSLLKPPRFETDGYVQDLSSRQACELFAPQPGETVIDLCAAPGGKSFTVAGLMANTGRIISCDINRKKLNLVENGAKKLGLSIIETHVNDAKVFNPDFPKADRVLCDVPCSGLGVIRRKPEIKYKPESDFEGLPEIQLRILLTGSRYVKDGGFLMYSTCTLSRRENDEVIDDFLHELCGGFRLVEKRTVIPSEDGGDGFFMALLERTVRE
ncbi:MAG: 16S rRNA (cytosine(967)-C(5))-methyltransferase RsmB [Oscillospiraceae bacterium]|nr:16S rRNA (cytosine(967)-C(5))-methyltransferase RsmB [Oscillospiraceae bacterium]